MTAWNEYETIYGKWFYMFYAGMLFITFIIALYRLQIQCINLNTWTCVMSVAPSDNKPPRFVLNQVYLFIILKEDTYFKFVPQFWII